MAKHALPDLVRPPVWDIEDGHDYLTLRIWDVALPPLVVVGMNPGKPQTTSSYVGQYIQRATLIAVRFGFGGLMLVNHWTIAESDSTRALAAPVKVGPRADAVLHEVLAANRGVPVLGAWGDAVAHVDDLCGYRVRRFLDLAAEYDRAILCVGVNEGSGQPRHLSWFRPFDLEKLQLLAWPSGEPALGPVGADAIPTADPFGTSAH